MTIVMGEIVEGCELLLIRVYVSAVKTANFNFYSNEKTIGG
jgi:hypothetical protein